MSEIDLDSPKINSSEDRRRSSAILSWADTNTPEPEEDDDNDNEVPKHLFLSPTSTASAHSSSSHSKETKKRIRKKQSSDNETSFILQKERKTKVSILPKKDSSETILSSVSHSQDYSSSDSDDLFSTQKQADISVRSKSKFKTNKIHDLKVQLETRETKNENVNDRVRSEHPPSRFLLDVPKKSDRRSSVGGSSIDTEFKKSITSASEISYKDRIRDRFNKVKEKAVESLSSTHSRPPAGFRKHGRQRKEDSLKQEEYELTAAMKRHEEIKMRWQKVCKASIEGTRQQEADEEESTFFSDDEQVSQGPISPVDNPITPPCDKVTVEDPRESKVLTSDLLGFKEDWDLVEFVKPQMTDLKSNKLWKEKLFHPTTKPVPLDSKLEPGLSPRFPEKEGLYVGNKMNVRKSLKNKLEQRILMTPEGRKWFGRDGELISGGCPLKSVATRPYVDEEGNQTISKQLIWKSAALADLSHRYMDLSGNLNYVLDIDVTSVEFSHHPLFSKEHVLTQRLKELYIKYRRRKEMDALNRLNGRLQALRRTRDNLKNIVLQGGDATNLNGELQEFENDIKEVRRMRYVEGTLDKQLEKKILMTWKDLVKLRERQGFQNTSVKLNVKKKVPESEQDERIKWESDLKQEVAEVLEEKKNEYKRASEEYEEKHQLWLKKIENADENEDSIQRTSDNETDDEQDDEDKSEEKEPKPPKAVIASEVKATVSDTFKESFRGPDEPELEFVITKDGTMDTSGHNNKEEMRRTAVKRCMVFVKLFYNGKEVCRSKAHPLSQKFTVKIGQRFAVRILEWPESLMLEIHEETGTLTKNNLLVTGIYLPLPDSFTTVQNSEVVKHEFSSDISITYHHAAVGSGNEFIPCPEGSDFNNQPTCLFTSGIVACRVGWMDDNGKILAPTEKYWNNIRDESTMTLSEVLLSGGVFDVSKLKEWAHKSKLDPNDPYNSAFFHFLENAGDVENSKPNHFRLNPMMKEFDFCDETELDKNPRLKLLKLRDTGEPEFSESKMVPLNEKQIPREIFKDYERRMSMQHTLTKVHSTDPIDGHRVWGKMYLEQVQQMLLKQCIMSRQSKRYQDIITEENVPDIGTLGLTFMKWLRPKRPLRPIRKERKKIIPQNFSGQEIKIVVNVVRAFEVPVRKDIDSKSTNGSIDGFSLVNVRPFVEISFQGATARTTAAEGANPTWNQDLHISLNNKNGHFSTGNFHSIKDTLYLHLFDEIVIDLIEDDSARETNIHQRLEKHWLASMEIPFSTLYFNSRIEGTFKLYSPPILLGYEREAHRLHFSGATGQEPLLPQRDATYITLFVTVQPALNPPKPIMEKMECSETPNLEKHLEGWLEEVTNLFPHRKVKALVLDITGKSVCVTRFVRPLPLPPIGEDEENTTQELIARFVSMIPHVTESTISSRFFDIWLNADQVLRLLSGDYEDHAILLCGYFLKMGFQAYLLLGSGIPHGFMAYVLVKETIGKATVKYFIWDPTNGQKYNVDDSFCPLQKVYCVINDQNIWANVQAEEMPRRTRFDLTKRADWFPAFGKNVPAPIVGVQPEFIDYKTTSRQAVDFLQDKIEKRLRDNLMKWRKRKRTQWNRYCAATLRKLLPSLERSTWNVGDHTPDHVMELQHILGSHKMCGFPINMAFTRLDSVTEAVKATGVHCNETEGVEFALAVYIHPYPNNILSVWVYVASVVRRR
ncbi:hypothetical protein RUM43_014703 [Polyplax serrata]|uniref:C2 domain-containing protein n=1 Tax=Polyplax serrata TaxID=468196 RepID=A0AAN8NIP9_POLSC